MHSLFKRSPVALASCLLLACTGPSTQFASLSPDLVRAEQLRQQQMVITSSVAEQQRLADIAMPMMRQAAALCGERIAGTAGVLVSNLHSWPREYHVAARSLGYSDTLRVIGVVRGSAAERVGVKVGSSIVSVDGRVAPVGRTAVADFITRVASSEPLRGRRGPVPIRAQFQLGVAPAPNPGETATLPQTLDVPLDTACAFGFVAQKDDALNAYADGKAIYITTAMMRFAASDDELSVVVAHEIAHNAMRHIDAKERNSGFGALLGAVLDVAAAANGVNTGGDFSSMGAQAGATAFSQDFEREADYVGMYILARSGRPTAGAAEFWRRMAQESPGSIKYASTHPTTAERFIRLEQAAVEIEAKRTSGDVLMPTTTPPKTP